MKTTVMDEMPVGRFSLMLKDKVVFSGKVGDSVAGIVFDRVIANPSDIYRVIHDIERSRN